MSLVANGTGVAASAPDGLILGSGTVSAPGLRLSAVDATTGFYRPATNQMALASNGVRSWLVDANAQHTFGPASGTAITHEFQGQVLSLNATIGSGVDAVFKMQGSGANQICQILGITTVAQDTGSVPVIVMDARRSDNTALSSRPLLSIRTNGTEFLNLSATGSFVAGPVNTTSFAAGAHVLHGVLNAGGSGTGSAERRMILNANAYESAFSGAFRTRTTGIGGVYVQMFGNSSNTAGSFVIAMNKAGDGATANATDTLVGAQDGTWTIGNLANRTGISHISNGNMSIYRAEENVEAISVLKNTSTNTSAQIFVRFYSNAYGTGNGMIVGGGASTATFATFSDVSLKENIVPLTGALAKILALNPVEFDYRDGSGHQVGFVAQQVEPVFPEDVATLDGKKTLAGWSKREAYLVKAIQELEARLSALEGA